MISRFTETFFHIKKLFLEQVYKPIKSKVFDFQEMEYWQKLAVETVVVGIVIVIIGTIVSLLLPDFFKVKVPEECKNWNKRYAMEISLFVTGVLAHLLMEAVGVNKWYCTNGAACPP